MNRQFNKLIIALLAIWLPIFSHAQPKQDVLQYLKSLGHGKYVFGQVATWMHNENPDMDSDNNWVHKVYAKTGELPRYGVVTYDFEDNPFTDAEWNSGVEKMWNAGMLAGIYSWYANPSGTAWNGTVDIDQIFQSGSNPTKENFYKQMDRMAGNLLWLKNRNIPVIYTPFVELDDGNKWHSKGGKANAIRLYQLVHDYFTTTKGLDNVIWAFHTTQNTGALPENYPGDDYVEIIGKSAYGKGLPFTEYSWAVEKKKNKGKIIWWAELGIRDKSDQPRDCMDVLKKLNESFPELAGFVFWSDEGFYNVVGNLKGKELMQAPGIVTATPFDPKNPHVHDPVMAKEGNTYHVFGTGKGISNFYSNDMVTWTEGKPVFDEVPEWTRVALPGFDGDIWAPDIIFYQGNYHLFYACNATPGKPNAAIGHATNPTLDQSSPKFKWTDHGKIVQSVLGRDLWQAIDPNIVLDEKGTPWFIFGSFWDGIKAVKMTDDLMKLKWPEEWHTIARRPSTQKLYNYGLEDSQIEGAFVYRHGDYFYLFASFDMCCRGVNSNYHVVVGRSKSVTGPYLDKAGFDMIDGNGTDFAIGDGKKWAALGHNSVYNIGGKELFVAHGYSIADKGDSKLIITELKWDVNGWPVIELP